jgi:hypothetical protein
VEEEGARNQRLDSPNLHGLNQPFLLQFLFNAGPNPGAGVEHGNEQLCLFGNVAKIIHETAAYLAVSQVLFLFFRSTGIYDQRQVTLKFGTVHLGLSSGVLDGCSGGALY